MINKKWLAINLLLLAVSGLLAWRLSVSIEGFNRENEISEKSPARPILGERQTGLAPAPAVSRYNAADFRTIADQTLFSDTRSRETKEEAPSVPEAALLKIRPILVGVNIGGGHRFATLIDPTAPAQTPGTRRGLTRTIGDVYENYTIVDITETEVVLENGARREVIPLFNQTRGQAGQRGKTAILASRVVAFGPKGGASPAAPPGVVPEAPRSVITTSAQPTQVAANTLAGPSPRTAQPVAAPPRPVVRGIDDSTNRRVIRTPFGDIVSYSP